MTETNSNNSTFDTDAAAHRGGTRRWLLFLGAIVLTLTGIAIGVGGHSQIMHLVGLHGHGDAGKKKQLWTCGMHPQVIKEEPGMCPICQMKLEPMDVVQSGNSAMTGGKGGARKIKYWHDPMMNPPYISQQPGKSPMGMDLVPVYEEEGAASSSGGIQIDPVVVQNMGVRLATLTRGPVRRDVRAVGFLAEAEPNIRDVNLRVSGWIEKLHAATLGMAVSKGTPLFDLYSPDVQVGVEELIAARRTLAGAPADRVAQSLLDASRRKLELWGLGSEQVESLSRLDAAPRTVTFVSPIDGYLTQKSVVEGAAVRSGDAVMRIVDLSTVWVDAQVHAQDLPVVRLGQTVTATIEGMPGKQFEGKVVFLAPQVDPQTRTAIVRIALPNNELNLRPGMYAIAHLRAELVPDALLAPREAIIDTGTRQVVFVATGDGHFTPRDVRVGHDGEGGVVEVLSGVSAGEQVVTSGQFLLDAESRMREAIQKHLSDRLATGAKPAPGALPPHAGHSSPLPQAMPAFSFDPDPVYRAYLAVQEKLGASDQSAVPVDVSALLVAVKQLAPQTEGTAAKAPMVALAAAAQAMANQPRPEQRKLYKPVSEAAITLAGVAPPSRAVAEKLFVANCPMAPGEGGRWLQTTPDIANPYFATAMKACGNVERSIAARPASTQPATQPASQLATGPTTQRVAPSDHAGHADKHETTQPKGGGR